MSRSKRFNSAKNLNFLIGNFVKDRDKLIKPRNLTYLSSISKISAVGKDLKEKNSERDKDKDKSNGRIEGKFGQYMNIRKYKDY